MNSMILGLCLAAVTSPAPAPETALVSFELREGERLLGAPTLQVRLGEPASLRTSGANGYAMTVTVERVSTGRDYLVRSQLYRPAGESWQLVASPALQVVPGERSRIVLGRAARHTYSLAVTVR